jgi:hypothetical protein
MTRATPSIRFSLSHTLFVVGLLSIILLLFASRGRLTPAGTDVSGVFMTEVSASNQTSIPDEEGAHSDWIEIANVGDVPINLDGWYLTDSFRRLTRWRFPAVSLAPAARLLVYASGKDRRDAGRPLHANFHLNERGEYLALVRPDGRTIAHEFLPKYPRLRGVVTYGLREKLHVADSRSTIPADAYRFFTVPTPGRPNEGDAFAMVALPKISLDAALLDRPTHVTISTRTPGARICFTTDGSTPSEVNGDVYRGSIPIRHTTTLKVAAFHPDLAPTEVLTRSYIFPNDVSMQTGEGFPTFWGYTNGQPVAADYRLSRAITENPVYRKDLIAGLREIPTVSLVTTVSNLFDPATGIYANPTKSGREWERAASMELIQPDGRTGFQIDCGVRIQGGWNRRPEECPKHSLRVVFKREYGATHLEFPLFGKAVPVRFETLVLRGGCNNTWLHWSGEERHRGDYIRDEWLRQTSGAMGIQSARGFFVHLYLNGLYWGVYNLTERPDASLAAAVNGGTAEDYDSRNADKILSGDAKAWNAMFAIANRGLADDATYRAIAELLDLSAFSDYMLVNYYGANADWDRASNWYAARRRNPPGKYQFYVWDGERTLENPADNTMDFDDDLSPSRLFHKLNENAAFRKLFAERARLHCSPGGALDPAIASARFAGLSKTINDAIVAESARWGAYRRDVHQYKTGPYELYTRDDHWKPEIERLLEDYFPRRTKEFTAQLKKRGIDVGP